MRAKRVKKLRKEMAAIQTKPEDRKRYWRSFKDFYQIRGRETLIATSRHPRP